MKKTLSAILLICVLFVCSSFRISSKHYHDFSFSTLDGKTHFKATMVGWKKKEVLAHEFARVKTIEDLAVVCKNLGYSNISKYIIKNHLTGFLINGSRIDVDFNPKASSSSFASFDFVKESSK